MRIATWNINGLRARLDFLKHWLAAREPDIVGLQELKLDDDLLSDDLFADVGYHTVAHGQKAWNGVAILSREPAEVVQLGLPSQEGLGARLITARTGGLTFSTIYCPNGKHVGHEDFPRKLDWLDALIDHVSNVHRGDPSFVLCGDFNLCPGPLDTWSEELLAGGIFHTSEERSRFTRLLDLGLVDLYRHHHPDGRSFSWWDYRAGAFHQDHGLRIDFLVAAPEVAARVREVATDRDYRKKKDGLIASDHAPVIVDLE